MPMKKYIGIGLIVIAIAAPIVSIVDYIFFQGAPFVLTIRAFFVSLIGLRWGSTLLREYKTEHSIILPPPVPDR